MEKKPTNPYFSVSVGKEKKYLNVVVTSGKENPSVVSVNAQASAKEILLALPVQNMLNEALASILSYIAQRDSVADSAATYYGPLVTALVRSRYSKDDVEAIVNNALMVQNMPSSCNEIEERSIAAEFEDFENFRLQCKARAKEILALMKQAEA
jgi:hypothetical protein